MVIAAEQQKNNIKIDGRILEHVRTFNNPETMIK